MNNDLDVIIKQFPNTTDWNTIRLYALGDIHVGSEQFDERSVRKKIEIIRDDPHGVAVICGDVADFGLKNSKTNVYQATMQPKEQIEYVYELFKPIAQKLSAVVPGNHEERITREVGLCPLYDLCVRWGVPEVYRENVAITKYSFGNRYDGRPIVFIGVTTHGTTRNKHHKHMMCYDADFSVSGHTHSPSYTTHGRIAIDRINATAKHVPYKEIVVDANLHPGGYGIKHEYEIPPPPELQYLELSMYRETNWNRTQHRIINYHTITL